MLSRGRRAMVAAAVVLVAVAVVRVARAPPARADDHNDDGWPIYPLVFPVAGEHRYSDTWGAPRSGNRTHTGTDIMADKMVPVVAAADGTVGWMHDEQGGRCCAMSLDHDDGWRSYYIHLNNDTPGTDDGLGWGFAPGIEKGVHVTAGQHIGWVGDSGNAERTAPHLHIELHLPDGTKINPYPSLREAQDPDLGSPPPPPPPPPEPEEVAPVCVGPEHCDGVAMVEADGRYHLRTYADAAEAEAPFYYGNPGDVPLMGDWDCDGTRTPAMYRPSNGFMYLRNSNTSGVADVDYFYGDPSDIPLAGDFDGDGCDTLAIYRAGEGRVYVKNSLGTGVADYDFYFGNPGDKPFVGDFDGDGIDTVGLHREDTGFVYFRNTNESGPAEFKFFYGDPGDRILAGDWDGDGTDTVAIYRPSTGTVYFRMSNTAGMADHTQPVGDFAAALVATGGPPAPAPAETLLVAAGDIAACDTPGAEETALLLDDIFADGAGVVAPLGDLAYPDGSAEDFANCYGPTWGRHLERTRPTPGGREYQSAGAGPYFDYFGDRAGEPGSGYYSYDLGDWHVVVLNSNCDEVGGCGEGSPQHQWLQGDLAASSAQCTVAYMHHPRFASGPAGGNESVIALWEELWAAGAEAVLGGQNHLYERFAPQDPYGQADAEGIRQFVAGTGGHSLDAAGAAQPHSEAIVDDAFGVLVLTLGAGHYHWGFVSTGGDVLDAGEASCF